MNWLITRKVKKVKVQIDRVSLVGIYMDNVKYPIGFGNYFEIFNSDKINKDNYLENYYVVNMCAENFKEIVRRLKLEEVEIEIYNDPKSRTFCFIIDRNIPRDWLTHDHIYTTGCLRASEEMEIYLHYIHFKREMDYGNISVKDI